MSEPCIPNSSHGQIMHYLARCLWKHTARNWPNSSQASPNSSHLH